MNFPFEQVERRPHIVVALYSAMHDEVVVALLIPIPLLTLTPNPLTDYQDEKNPNFESIIFYYREFLPFPLFPYVVFKILGYMIHTQYIYKCPFNSFCIGKSYLIQGACLSL